MERFLRAQVKMFAELKDIKLTRIQLQEIVNNMMGCDEVWDLLAVRICEEIEKEVR